MAESGHDRPVVPSLVADWITIWQSELSAAAADRERIEAWSRLVTLWAAGAHAAFSVLPPSRARSHESSGPAATEPSPRPASADAAPDARDAALAELARRVADLERRLAERAPGGA